jgi:uncharacterized transporter YbjL
MIVALAMNIIALVVVVAVAVAAIHILGVKLMITAIAVTIATLITAAALDMISSMVHFHISRDKSTGRAKFYLTVPPNDSSHYINEKAK